jgi:hypothetical protein
VRALFRALFSLIIRIFLFVFRRWAFLRLLAERKGIRDDILTLGR